MIRKCPCCNIDKELDLNNFTSNKQRKNGYSFYCKSCRSKTRGNEWQKYYKNDPEALENLRIRQRNYTNNTLSGKAITLLKAYKTSDRNKNRFFDLPKKWFIENILEKTCYYCGSSNQIGADRINNSKGHSMDNVLPCCSVCNSVRSDIFTVEEMIKIGKTIKELRIDRDIEKISGKKLKK